jgi:hypothetical protein
MVAHRFLYRPTDKVLFASHIERRSLTQHITQLIAVRRALEVDPGRSRAA